MDNFNEKLELKNTLFQKLIELENGIPDGYNSFEEYFKLNLPQLPKEMGKVMDNNNKKI